MIAYEERTKARIAGVREARRIAAELDALPEMIGAVDALRRQELARPLPTEWELEDEA